MSIDVKICGLTNTKDAQHALACGADYLGFVLYDQSPRGITAEALLEITTSLPGNARCIGVFVNTKRADVEAIAHTCRLHAVQIHGDEQAADFQDMPLPLWRAARLESDGVQPSPDEWNATRYVLDAAPAGVYGGAGITVDWTAAQAAAKRLPVMLAGGLTPENVREAIIEVSPLGVDTSSGVEASAGCKDPEKVATFIKRAKTG